MRTVLALASVMILAVAVAKAEDKPAAPAAGATCAKAACFSCDKCGKTGCAAHKCCGADMASCKVLTIQDGKAICCACGGDCKCTLKADDPTKCSCGKAVKTCALTGKFVCAKCTVIADKAGKCACGADLTEVK